MNNSEFRSSPRKQIIMQVLEAAKDNQDAVVIAACRRLLWANTLGWRKYRNEGDWKMVLAFAEA